MKAVSCNCNGGFMDLTVFAEKNQSLQSKLRTFLPRTMMTLITFALGYGSIVLAQNLVFYSNAGKLNPSVNIIQLDGPVAADLVRPTYPAQVLNKETKQWEVIKPDASNSLTDVPALPSPPQVLPIDKK
jgi:hypothetical protein